LRLVGISVKGFWSVGEVESGDLLMEGDNFLLQQDGLVFRGPFWGRKQGHGLVRVHGVRVGFWFCDLCSQTFVQVRGAS